MRTPQVAEGHLPEIASEGNGSDEEAVSHRMDRGPMRLVAAVQALSLARSLDAIIEIVRKAARDISLADGATFILREDDNCYYADEDSIAPLWKGRRFPISACISGWVMTNKHAVVIPDIYADDRVPLDAYRPTFVKSLVVAPIRTQDPIGALGLYWAEHHAASEIEIRLLQALADSTAVAMENIRVYAELEERVKDRTRQLQAANDELETFSYSVSHDLQAPLSHIIAYSNLLMSDHLEALDEEARRCITRMEVSATRMSALINDLLRLARYTRAELHLAPVDLSRTASELAARLLEEHPDHSAEFEIEDNLRWNCDEALLRIVLQNLLANALKFTAKREKALIEFGAAPQPDGSLAYFVRDNGAGFDMRNTDKLFGPFQRLHAAKDFSGSGIGLATAKRIIHRHGGAIWAEAAVDKGATFFFTLGGHAHNVPLHHHA